MAQFARNRPIRPCHPSHSMPLALILSRDIKGSITFATQTSDQTRCVCVVCVPSHVFTDQGSIIPNSPCTDARRTATCVTPVDALRDFYLFILCSPIKNEQRGGWGGGVLPYFLRSFSFSGGWGVGGGCCHTFFVQQTISGKIVFSGWQPIR